MARATLRAGAMNVRRYALNRAVRVLPLYSVVLATVLILQYGGGSFEQWWRFGLFLQNFSANTALTVDGPMWSLGVEMQYYLLLPLLALGIGKMAAGSLRRAAIVLAFIGVVSFAIRYRTVLDGTPADFQWQFSLPSLMFFFVSGMLLALLKLAWERRTPGWLGGVLGSSDLWMFASFLVWLVAAWKVNWEAATALACFIVTAACVLPLRDGWAVRILEWRPLALLGVASYSLYLWHVPLFNEISGGRAEGALGSQYVGDRASYAVLMLVGVPLACAISLVSYRWIKAPFLRLRRQWGRS